MSDSTRQPEVPVQERDVTMFAGPEAQPRRRGFLFGMIGAVLAIVIGASALIHHSSAGSAPLNAILPPDPYAANLTFTQLAMSESESLSGGKSTFLDGKVKNSGVDTLTGVTMQVLFKNDEGLAPAVETLPLSLIRTHEPYVDTEPVGAAPLKPGDEAEFRLVFETMTTNWNQQMPELRVVHVVRR